MRHRTGLLGMPAAIRVLLGIGSAVAIALACEGVATDQLHADASGGPVSPGDPVAPECGPASLYLLLKLTGHDVRWKTLAERMAAVRPTLYSMSDLQVAAKEFGLRVRGVELTRRDVPLDRPVIIRMKFANAEHGHFAILNPVGVNGTSVELIDPPNPATLLDYDRLLRGPGWTGEALMPHYLRDDLAYAPHAVIGILSLALARRMTRPWAG